MSKAELMNNMSRTFHKIGFKLKKHSPEILVTAGVVGTVASTVMACKATTKLSTILEESKDELDAINGYVEDNGYSEKYTEEDKKKDLTIVYTKSAVKVAKLYAPAVILGTASITSILAGHNILRKRNAAIAAAYAVVDKSFKDYRGRVVERFGKELDHELRHNIKAKEIEEVVVNEDGTEATITKTANVIENPLDVSEFARFFDESCSGWTKDPEYNLAFLRGQQEYANKKLQAQGYLFLNEVYEMLGMDRSKAGQVVGWIYDEKCPIGDNFVDFGIYEGRTKAARAFVNGYERTILLDFNVDGNILDLM